MKQKNLNIVQRHVEKAVLGVVLVAALVILYLYVIGSPYNVQIAGQDRAPDEVEDVVYNKAKGLNSRIIATEDPLPDMPVLRYTDEFRDRVNRRLVGVDEYSIPPSWAGIDPDDIGGPIGVVKQTIFNVPTPPAPADIKTRSGNAVLAELEGAVLKAEFEELIGQQVPRDFQYVSVLGLVDLNEWSKLLAAGDPETRIPPQWWQGRQLITNVILERQRWDDNTQQWLATESIEPLPGSAVVPEEGKYLAPEARRLLSGIENNQDTLQRPEFAPLADQSPDWIRPDAEVRELTNEQQRMVRKLEREIEQLDARKRAMEKSLNLPEQPSTPGLTVEGFRPVTDGSNNTAQLAQARKEIDAIEKSIEEKQAQVNKIYGIQEEELLVPDNPFAGGTWGNPFQSPVNRQPRGLQGAQQSSGAEGRKVWAHDVSAEPGATYRYRLRVRLLNPLFQQNGLAPEQRAKFYNRISLESRSSEWTEPITIDPDRRLFFVNSSNLGVEAELWQLHNGQWQTERALCNVGDPVVATVTLEDGSALTLDAGIFVLDTNTVDPQGADRDEEVLFIGPATDGQIASRRVNVDSNDPARTKLLNQRNRTREQPTAPDEELTVGGGLQSF